MVSQYNYSIAIVIAAYFLSFEEFFFLIYIYLENKYAQSVENLKNTQTKTKQSNNYAERDPVIYKTGIMLKALLWDLLFKTL